MKNNNITKPFLVIIIFLSILVAAFHFIRLSFGWNIVIESWSVPTLLSGTAIVIAVFMIYWSWLIWKAKKEDENKEKKHIDMK